MSKLTYTTIMGNIVEIDLMKEAPSCRHDHIEPMPFDQEYILPYKCCECDKRFSAMEFEAIRIASSMDKKALNSADFDRAWK